jgi:hydrogenase nickel incorporation protein HypA/HybF
VRQLDELAEREDAQRITRVLLRIGPLSGVVPELLVHAFPLAAAGTCAQDARIDVEDAPVRVRCTACGEETDASASRLVCGACGDYRTRLAAGDELLLARVELDRVGVPA